jgi:hypothetical protein
MINIKKTMVIIGVSSVILLNGCSSGELRSFNDAMSTSNGYTVSYPNQSDTTYAGDVKWVIGVYNGSGFMDLKNTDDQYCKVKITFEDETTSYYRLEPYESRNDIYMSIYNQGDYIDSLCHSTRAVFNQSIN